MSKGTYFVGFRSPNFTTVPNEIFDELMADLSGAEVKVLLYIVRRTFGWNKDRDEISLGQITRGIKRRDGTIVDRGTGLATSTAQTALKALEERGIITAVKRVDPEKGTLPTVYGLRYADDVLPLPGTGGTDFRQGGPPEIGMTPYLKSVAQNKAQYTDQNTEETGERPEAAPPTAAPGTPPEWEPAYLIRHQPPDIDLFTWREMIARQPAEAARLVAERGQRRTSTGRE